MISGYTLPNKWLFAARLSFFSLLATIFFSFFSLSLLANESTEAEYSVLPKGEENCESDLVDDFSPPDYFINPGEGKRVDLYYKGLKNILPVRVDIPNIETVEKVYVEVVYKGKLPSTSLHSAIQATLQDGSDVNLTPKLISGSWGSNGVGIFYGEVGKTDRIQLNFEVEEATAQSVLLYVLRNEQLPGIYQAGTYANFYGYRTSVEFDIPLLDDGRRKDIRVTIPVTEITTDGRVLDFEVSAGGVVKNFQRKWSAGYNFDNQCCIDSVETVLYGVENADVVNIKVISPNDGGQSFVLSGIISAEVSPICNALSLNLPTEICTENTVVIECVSPGAGYTAEWDFGPGATPRTFSGFGEVFIIFSEENANQKITVEVSSPTCVSTEEHYLNVEKCSTSNCALEAATVIQHPANGNSNGIIELDLCVTCGSTPPYRVFYTYQGKQFEKGPFNEAKPRLTNLPEGTYSMIYVIDANGCRTNITGPVTLCNGGCGNAKTCPQQVCTLTGFNHNNEQRSLWLTGLGINSRKWQWVGGTGDLIVTGPNSIRIEGKVTSLSDPTCGFDVHMVFNNRRNWAEWSALGRDWKGNRNEVVDNQHTTWDYYEMVAGESKLTGFGCWTGTLSLTPFPLDQEYGLQIGEGANDQNLSPGLSAWYTYDGTLNGTHFSGRGDINDEGTCRIADLTRNAVPIISCAADFAVSCGGSPDDAPRPEINCGNPEDYTLSYEDREISATPRKLERTWTAAGPGGPATCKQIISFGDDTPPVFTKVPTEDRMLCGEVVPQQAEATDDCSAVTISFRETEFNKTCPGNFDLRRVWTATDESGNTATAELIVHVIDEEGPKFQSKPFSVVIDCGDDIPTDQPVAIDACGGTVGIDYRETDCEAQNPVYTWDGGKLTYLTEGEDPCADHPTSLQGLQVEAVCSDDPSVRRRWRVLNSNNYPVWMNKVEAYGRDIYNDGFSVPANGDLFFFTPTEAGDKTVTITWNDGDHKPFTATSISTGDQCELTRGETCACAVSRIWKATDECENASWYVQLVWMRDTDAPTLRNIPADRTYSAGTAIPGPANVTATDDCSSADVVFSEERIESADYNCEGAAVHYLFGWESTQNPFLTLNGQQYIAGDEPLRIQENCGGTAVITGSLVDVTNPSKSFDLVWNLKDRRTFTEHSGAGGNATTDCSTANKSAWSFYQLETNSRLTGTGGNSGITLSVSSANNKWIQLGAGANQNNCKLGIFGDITYTNTSGNFSGTQGTLRGALSSVELQEAGSCADGYTLIRSWIATDHCGNQVFERQVIRVVDEEKPTFEAIPNDLTIDCSDPIPTANVSAIDNSDDDVEVTLDERDEGDACNRIITRTWTAVDDCGNTRTARQKISIKDEVAPVITFNNPEIEALNSGDLLVISCSDVPTIDETIASVTDNCDTNPNLTFQDQSLGQGDCGTDGYRERFRCTWTALDQCGNETVFFIFVEFHDDSAPVLAQVPTNKTQSCDVALPTDQPTASDNCSENPTIVETQSTIPGACSDSYQIVRLWTATDDCGNTATASQVITLNDDTAPVFSNVPNAVTLNCEDAIPTAEPTATDNCDQNVRVIETQDTRAGSGGCGNSYVLVRLWTATDNCGNTATASQVVTVEDNEKPTITFANARLNGLSDGAELIVECDDIPFFSAADVVVNDNCDNNANVTFTDNLVSQGNCATSGFVKHFTCTWTAVDACGNTERISIELKVRDNSIPTIASVPGDISISCEQSLPTSQPTISDNCTSDSELTVSETSTTEAGSCSENYKVIRLWTVTDACGNVATASQVISVDDEVRPILAQVPESLTVSCDDPFPTTLPTATDNCDTDVSITVQEDRTDGGCGGNASVVRVFTATDNCGNTATASQVVTIRDRSEPTLAQVPANATLSCTDAIPTSQPVATDNCDENVNVVETSERRDGACPDSYEFVRRWTATDACGNTSTASQVLTIQDTEVPVLASLPQNTTIRCDEQLPTNRPTATDNCDNDVNIAETQETRPGACENSYEVVRLFTATDNCGNTATGSQIVTVQDIEAPVFAYVPANLAISCAESIPTEEAQASDNCDQAVVITERQDTRAGNCAGTFDVVRLFTATDHCGNTATASQVVSVFDDEAPSFAGVPSNTNISCEEALPTTAPTASDNCDTNVDIQLTETREDGACADSYRIIRSWVATDHCGNAATASQIVTVQDQTVPVFAGVPQNITIACSQSLPTTQPTATDNCDDDVTITEAQRTEAGPCTDSYKVIRIWTAVDNCGNTSTAQQEVQVEDREAPSFANVPASVSISCDDPLPSIGPDVTDNCDEDVSLNETQETRPGACPESYEVIRTWTATDNCGNVETASQVVTVTDEEAPSFAFVPATVTIDCDASLPASQPEVNDNCDNAVNVVETQETQPGSCGDSYTVIRIWTATDNCGNAETATQVVNVQDVTAPVFANVPQATTVQCDAALPTTQPIVTDNCDDDVTVTEAQANEAGSCPGNYTVVRTWTAVDNCGNTTTAVQRVTVEDTQDPVFTQVPTAVTLSCEESIPTVLAEATDNCDTNVSITETQDRADGNCPGNFTITRIFTATDHCGNTATASQVVTFEDLTVPVFASVPSTVTVQCDGTLPTDLPTATDNCDQDVSIAETTETIPGNCADSYSVIRLWTATDNCGNTATATQVVNVEDTEAPSFANVPTTVTIECDEDLPTDMAAATDNCDTDVAVTVAERNEPGACTDSYTVVRVFTAVDNCGNTATAEQRVNVVDTQAPTFVSVPQATTIECDADLPTTQPVASDNCDFNVSVTEAQSNEPGSCPGNYTVVRTWTAVDDCGNTATAVQRVTVEDTQAPVFTQVPTAVTLSCEESLPTDLSQATDNCDTNVSITENQDRAEGNCPGNFTVTRIFTATDNCGNTATASQVVTFEDRTVPVFASVPATVTVQCDGTLPTDLPTASDNCDQDVSIAETTETRPGACTDSYSVIRLWTATDNCGNTATASQIVNVEDTEAPSFVNVPQTVTVECDAALPTDMATATDNCDTDVEVSVAERNEPGACTDSYTVIRVFTAVDNCGNTATAEQRVNVVDTQAPTFASVPQAVTISCDEALPTTAATATDNCDTQVTITEAERTVPGACADSYEVIRLFTATDNCGNTATAEQTVTVQDTQAPTFASVPQDMTIRCDEALPTSAPIATDNCDAQVAVTEEQRTEPGACAENFTVVRTWTAVDNCGNTATAEQRVTLTDEVDPVFASVPVGVTIACDQPLPSDLPVATDNCDDNVSITEAQETIPGNCPGAYEVIRTFTATDGCGNTATASQTVKVEDLSNPVFANVPTSVTISCDEALPTDQPTATDTCDDNVDIAESEEFLAGVCGGSYRVIRQWTATDDCGNTSTATQLVTVQDLTAPTFASVPTNVDLSCDDAIPTDLPTATDNCDDDVHISETQQRMPGGCADSYSLVRTFTATDECGNTATASQVVNVEDSAAPEFASVPTDVDISCDEAIPTDMPTATDSCDDDVTITEAQQTIPGACPGAYQIIRTWTAVDNCGNTVSAQQTINVGDRAEPTFVSVPAAVTIGCDGNLPTDQAVAVDNCDDNVNIAETQTTETGECADSYRVIRTWTATDDCGNVATVSQVVTIEDNTNPEFVSVPPSVSISCDQPLPTTQPRANDNCDTDVTITERTDQDRGSCGDSYTVTRIWTATDNCGNTATATQLVTVEDTTPPVFANVPASVTIQCDESAPDNEPTATDNCDDEVRIRSNEERIDGACADSYQLVRTWTAEDDCGNSATASQVITVIDPTSPTFAQIPPETTITCDESLPTSQPVTNDNCDSDVTITETQETLQGACPDSYVLIRTWVISDNCGNTDRATQVVNVIDSSEPTFASVPTSRTINCDEDPGDEEPVAVDNCDDNVAISMTETTNGDNCAEGIELIRIWTASDNCGNTATASQTITFKDDEAPILADVERSITVECDQPVPLIYPTATDNCDRDVDIVYFDDEQDEDCGKTITRTWVASDDCGNTSTAEQLIIIRDTQLPILNGVPASAQINCDDAIPNATVTATDNCTIDVDIAIEEFEVPGACPGERSVIRIWTATDDCGNAATGSQTITITDGGVPVFANIPTAVSISCTQDLPTDLPSATDNCGGGANAVAITVDETREAGNCANNYRIIRVFKATDDCGNTSTASQVVTVSDDEAPTFASVPADVNLSCGDQLPEGNATATDNCDNDVNVSMTERTLAGNCDDSYDVIRTYTAVDACGNNATATQTISISDNEAPSFTSVPENVEISCNDPIPTDTAAAEDDCDNDVEVSVVEDRVAGSTSNEFQIVRTWTALDNCGNTATASQVISVLADGEPTFTFVPEDISLSCEQDIPNADARATDNCDGDIQPVLSEDRVDGNSPNDYSIIRTWTATNSDGNSATATQTITVSDRNAPSFDQVPADVTLTCGLPIPTDMATASDVCDANVTVIVTETNRPGNCGSEFDVLRTFQATDASGNATTATQVVSFVDDQAPEFTFVPDSEEFQCSVGQPRDRAQATDNCTSNVQITFEDASPSSDCSQRLQRTWTATDECGNTATAVQQILLEDTEDPQLINVPANASIDLTNGGTIPSPANVSANDNCDSDPNVIFAETTQATSGCGYILVRTWEATDQCGNTDKATQRITVTEDAGVSINVDPINDCAPAGVQVHAVPANPGSTYTWTSNNGSFTNANTANPVFVPSGAGTYTINLTVSGSGCTGTATETITINGAMLNVSGNGPICVGGTIELTASAGADSYSWSGPAGFSASQANVTLDNATVAMGGVYTLSANFGACTQEATVTVNVSGSLQVALDIPSLICSNQTVTFSAGGADDATWTAPSGQTFTGATTQVGPINFGDHNGRWTVVATNAAGCSETLDFNVEVVRSPQLSATSNSPACEGGEIRLNAVGGANYQWTGPNGYSATGNAPVISDLSSFPSGTYQFIVEASNQAGCIVVDTAIVIVSGAATVNATVPSTICEGETLNLSATGADSYVWTGPNGFASLSASPSIQAITTAGSGTYVLNAETAAGCSVTENFTVTVDTGCIPNAPCNLPSQSDFTVVQPDCGQSNGSITFGGNTTGYSFDWSAGQGSGLAAGTYQLTVTKQDDAACTETYNFNLECNPTTTPCNLPSQSDFTVVQPDCGQSNGSITFGGNTTGYSFDWSSGQASALAAGTYQLTVTKKDDAACAKTFSFTLECTPTTTPCNLPAQSDFTVVQPDCGQSNGSITFGSNTTGYSFVWSSGQATALAAGSYELTVTKQDDAACTETYIFTLDDCNPNACNLPSQNAFTVVQPDCNQSNGSITFNGDTTGYAFVYSVGQTTNLAAGSYSLTVTKRGDAACAKTFDFTLTEDGVPTAKVDVVGMECQSDGSVTIIPQPAGNYEVTWNDLPGSSTSLARTDMAAGDYTFTITGDNGCTLTQNVTVPNNCDCDARVSVIRAREIEVCLVDNEAAIGVVLVTQPVIPANFGRSYILADVSSSEVIRINKTGEFQVDGSSDFSIHQVIFDTVNVSNAQVGPGKTVQEIEQLFIQGGGDLCGAITTFGARFTTSQCCIIPEVTSTSTTDAACGQPNGTANVQIAGNVSDFAYTWTPNIGTPMSASGNIRGGLLPGTYNVRIENRADATCFSETTLNVGAFDIDAGLPTLTAATCGSSNGTAQFINAAAGLSFTWSDGVTGANRDDLPAGDYTVTITNGQPNCEETISVTIDAVADFGLSALVNSMPLCGEDNGSVTINASGGSGNFSYDWGGTATRTDLEAGLYTVRVTDQSSSCTDSVTFTLTEQAEGQVRITIADVALRCNGAMDGSPVFTLDYDTDFRFPPRITFVDSQGDDVNFGELGPGSYCMQIRDAEDCLAGTGCFEVTQPDALVVNVTAITAGCDNDGTITLAIQGGTAPYNFDWAHLPAANDPRDLTGLDQGQYTVFITDANGCVSTVNNINIGRNCGCSPTLPVLAPFAGDVCLTDAQVQLGTQVVSASTAPGILTAYLLADSDGIIVEIATSPEFLVTATGNYTIHGIVYDPLSFNLNSITTGSTSINNLNTQFIQGGGFLCVGLDLTGTAIVVDPCTDCNAAVGELSTTDPVIWCTDNGLPSVVNFDITSSTGLITYVLVDANGEVITISTVPDLDFEGRDAGMFTVYAVATENSSNLPLPGQQILPRSGCIDLSQGLQITTLTGSDCNNSCQVEAGAISNATPTTLCVNDLPNQVVVNATGQTGSQRAYVLTDMNNSIINIQDLDGTLEVPTVAVGQYRLFVLVYEDPITGLETGRSINNLSGCMDLSDSVVLTVSAGAACGQATMIDTLNAAIPINGRDTICFVLDPGFNPATTTYMLVGGIGNTGQSAFGDYTLLPNGCIVYDAGSTPGINVDTIIVIATDGGVTDTTLFIVTVTNGANTDETVNVNVFADASVTACPNNFPANFTNATATLSSGGISGMSNFGSYTVDELTGCLTYNANGTTGAFIDTVVVIICDVDLLVCHEVTYIISVLPQGQTIVRNVNQGDTLLLCPLSNLLFGTVQMPTLCTAPTQGTATFDATTGCFIYTAPPNYVGPDEVCIEVCDDQGVCVQLVVQINVLAPLGEIVQESTVAINIADCDAFGDYCLPIANVNIDDFALVLDGQPFRNTGVACDNGAGGTVINVDTGLHVLAILEIATGRTDTVSISVGCADCGFNLTPAIIDLTSCDDTALIEISLLQGNWPLFDFTLDGMDARGDLIANGTTTQLVVDTGIHQLIVRALDNNCQEIVNVDVRCDVGVVTPTGDTTIRRTIQQSFSDTICLADLNLSTTGPVTTLTDLCPGSGTGGEVSIDFDEISQCFVYTGLLPGVDTVCLEACTAVGCDTFGLVVNVLPPTPTMENGTVIVGGSDIFCIDTTELASPIIDVFNFCESSSGTAVEFFIDEDTYCVTFTGLSEGMEQGCFVICNAIACDTVFLNITVGVGSTTLPPIAVDDRDMTTKGTPVEINILANDTLNGPLVQLFPITLPANGNLFIVNDSIIRYTPNPDFCGGVDSFQYIINNGIAFDTATVRIDVACDDLVIFSGFSPNGDGVNDIFKILGIEDFPDNNVLIFNRWGNEVFEVDGYDNSDARSFKGRFGDKTLPDGTYFYVIDLGGDNGCRSGYLQIHR